MYEDLRDRAKESDWIEANRRSWNAATRRHNLHKKDQAEFLAGGGNTLFPEELELLGEVAGKRLLHLQCNSGQDSLSLAALGARVTGVDLSDEAVDTARELAEASGIEASFHRADVYEWLERARAAGERFDVVFSSYGCVTWLPDLDTWAEGIAGVLEPGGRFVLVEFHPAALTLDPELDPPWPYSSGGEPVVTEAGVGDYVADSGSALAPSGYRESRTDAAAGETEAPAPSAEFAWGLGEIVQALLEAGLALERLEEYRYSNGWRMLPEMEAMPGRRFRLSEAQLAAGTPDLPLMFGLVGRKPRPPRKEG